MNGEFNERIDEAKLREQLAPSLANEPNIVAAIEAFEPLYREFVRDLHAMGYRTNIEDAPDEVLDMLAVENAIELIYDQSAPRDVKVQSILRGPDWNRRLGTPSVITEIFRLYIPHGDITILQWYQYKEPDPVTGKIRREDRYRFKLVTNATALSEDDIAKIIRLINTYVKNERSQFDGFVRALASTNNIYVAVGCVSWKYTPIEAPTNWP